MLSKIQPPELRSGKLPVGLSPVPVYFLDRTSGMDVPITDVSDKTGLSGKANKLVCHICVSRITDAAERTSIEGRNTHCRTNPAGFTYTFDCYINAPGCAVFGSPSREHTWFVNHTWQLAVCSQCGEHLGWLFKGESRFFGLIRGRVVEGD
jgi:hypothetical protein